MKTMCWIWVMSFVPAKIVCAERDDSKQNSNDPAKENRRRFERPAMLMGIVFTSLGMDNK
jgi:hypothetical protein